MSRLIIWIRGHAEVAPASWEAMRSGKYMTSGLDIDFAAKVRWRMKCDRNPLLVTLQDKYAVRDYAETRGVRTAPIFYVTATPATIPFADLPEICMIKANHGWRWNILRVGCRFYEFSDGRNHVDSNGRFLDEDALKEYQLTNDQVVQICTAWLHQKHSEREWAYQCIDPKIIVEQFLTGKDGNELKDYRLYTFDGVVKAINVGSPYFRKSNTNVFLNTDWEVFPLSSYKEMLPAVLPQSPESLNELIDSAERLGAGVDFARIDLYDTSDGVVLGEITVYPSAGARHTPTSCPKFNRWLSSHWRLSPDDSLKAFALNMSYHAKSKWDRTFRTTRNRIR